MKKRSVVLFVLFISLFASGTFAQADSGGSEGGGLQPSRVSFKRDNGNGTCGAQAEIRVAFDVLPEYLPVIAEVRSEEGAVTGIVINKVDATEFAKKGYVSYCISSANIIPAGKLSMRFHYERSNQDFWVTESVNAPKL